VIFPQARSRGIDLKGFSIKTDALSLLNSAISHSDNYSVSGELYFNNQFGLTVGAGQQRENVRGLRRDQRSISGALRWYFKQDECNCSALFTGIYCGKINVRQSVDQQILQNNAVNYNISLFESGICAGYQVILLKHFIIDPTLQAGLELDHKFLNAVSTEVLSGPRQKGLILRMQLGIGYRF